MLTFIFLTTTALLVNALSGLLSVRAEGDPLRTSTSLLFVTILVISHESQLIRVLSSV
jgi:hypothetical protein